MLVQIPLSENTSKMKQLNNLFILFIYLKYCLLHIDVSPRLDAISEDNSRKLTTPTYDPRDNYKIDDIESGKATFLQFR